MASPSPPGGSQSLWMRPHVNHRLSCDGSCQWRASHMGLASELVCNPPSPASEVPHGSLRAFGQGIAASSASSAASVSAASEEERAEQSRADRAGRQHRRRRRERCERTSTRVSPAQASVRGVWMWCPPGERWCKHTRSAPSPSPTAEVGDRFPAAISLISPHWRLARSLCVYGSRIAREKGEINAPNTIFGAPWSASFFLFYLFFKIFFPL